MPRLRSSAGRPARRATAAPATATSEIGHSSGTNAVPIPMASPVAQAARRASRGGWRSIRPTSRPMTGMAAKATAEPRRPAAIAPVATGITA